MLPGHSLVTERAFYVGKWRFPNPSTNPGEHQLVGLVRFKMSSPCSFNRYYFLMNHFIGSPCFKMFVSAHASYPLCDGCLPSSMAAHQRPSAWEGERFTGAHSVAGFSDGQLACCLGPVVRQQVMAETGSGRRGLPPAWEAEKGSIGSGSLVWDDSNDLRPLASSYISKALLNNVMFWGLSLHCSTLPDRNCSSWPEL